MELGFTMRRHALILAMILFAGGALACDHAFDGCLGCTDDQLPVCVQAFVKDICENSGNPANCDAQRVYDDVERHVIISTGSHMSKVRSLVRSSRKYQMR
ncbi:MAG: hypothetical protein WBQ78_14565 [Gammaproteobacteria bacterium]